MRITDVGLLAGPGTGDLSESVSVLQCAEPVLVEPNGTLDYTTITSAARALRRLPAPTVLLGRPGMPGALVAAADVCLTAAPDPPPPWVCASADEFSECVHREPLAALSLVVLLRNNQDRSVWGALSEESAVYAMLLGSASFQEWLTCRGPSRYKPARGPAVLAERKGDTLRITLDRPEARNAIDSETRDALVELLGLASVDPRLTVEISGNGPCFCAGGDREEFGDVRDPAIAHAVRLTRHPGMALDAVGTRTTCFLHGACVGAGIEIPAFASTIVARPATTFSLPEVAMGLIPGAGGTVSIPRRVGRQRSAWLMLTGATIDAATALAWGLVDRIE